MKLSLILSLALLLIIALLAPSVHSQSPIFDSLNRAGASNGELEQLSIANQIAHNQSNAALKRANLLSRHVSELRKQNEQLRNELEQFRRQLIKTQGELNLAKESVSKVGLCLQEKKIDTAAEQLVALGNSLSEIAAMLGKFILKADGSDSILYAAAPDAGAPPSPIASSQSAR